MKDKDDFKINNHEYDGDAQATNESELLPIFDGMDFSGDIQPVEEFIIPEYEKNIRSKDRSENKRTEIKKKSSPIHSVLNTAKKKIAISIASVLAVVLVIVAVVFGTVNLSKNQAPVRSVFVTESGIELILTDGEAYPLSKAQEVKVSDDGMMLYFSKNTSSKTGKFDLRAVNIEKKSSIKKEGSFVDNGVDAGWHINGDGSYLTYSKTVNGFKTFYIYSTATGKTEKIADDVEEVFLPSNGDVLYFTRRVDSIYSLHRMRLGEAAHNVASNIDYVKFCDSDDGFEVLYTAQTGDGLNVNVFVVRNFEEPLKVCSNVDEVYANKYSYKGNLYYFIKDKSTVTWQDFISDTYFDSDSQLKRPIEGDYMVEKGFIFKRYVLDTAAYNAAMDKYNAKQQRDSIRKALDQIDLGLSVEDEYTCYVYNGFANKKLASGVKLDNVVAYSEKDAPRLIYRKSVIAVEDKITMDKLADVSRSGGVTSAIDYVLDKINGSYDLSNDCIYTWYDGTRVLDYVIKGFDVDKTEFLLASSGAVYTFDDGELYMSSVSKDKISKAQLIDTSVTDCSISEGYVYYSKSDSSEKLSLYRHSPENNKEHICDDIYCFFPSVDGSTLLLSKQQSENELVDIGIFKDGEYKQIDTDAKLKSFMYKDKNLAYLKSAEELSVHNSSEMFIYTEKDGIQKCSSGVTEILYIR